MQHPGPLPISITPFISHVAFDIRSVNINGRSMQLCLISRRSRYRAGTRYFRRGVDQQGHVANFNETEQIVLVAKPVTLSLTDISNEAFTALSFVQIRGSIPLYWAEINTLRYKPELQVMEFNGTVRRSRSFFVCC